MLAWSDKTPPGVAQVVIQMDWRGLKGRMLAWDHRRRFSSFLLGIAGGTPLNATRSDTANWSHSSRPCCGTRAATDKLSLKTLSAEELTPFLRPKLVGLADGPNLSVYRRWH